MKKKLNEIYTSLLATQVRFTHLLRSQGDNFIPSVQSKYAILLKIDGEMNLCLSCPQSKFFITNHESVVTWVVPFYSKCKY